MLDSIPTILTLTIINAGEEGIGADFGGGKQRIVCRETIREAEEIVRGPNAAQMIIVRAPNPNHLPFSFQYCVSVMNPDRQLFTPTLSPTPALVPLEAAPTDSLSNYH